MLSEVSIHDAPLLFVPVLCQAVACINLHAHACLYLITVLVFVEVSDSA
jgi:hypothetical protein